MIPTFILILLAPLNRAAKYSQSFCLALVIGLAGVIN